MAGVAKPRPAPMQVLEVSTRQIVHMFYALFDVAKLLAAVSRSVWSVGRSVDRSVGQSAGRYNIDPIKN